ncbi:hypothetical protein [Photobacterium phosphoreum]|uniref:hypothetical protein n=1 Tax=Photobacterium phosphoreum TaxID=659 RepID=UPI000D172502|nr:hypothetical protein [Photobacterium phosphoreum]PSW37355.1 hypothetical protein CTM87_07270 [Photobacterium phosphoreum]
MANHVVTIYTRSIFDDDIEDGSIDDFSDESSSVIEIASERVDMLVRLIGEGLDLADGHYSKIGDDEGAVGYRETIDNEDPNIIRFNLVYVIDQGSRNLKAYDIEVKAAPESNKVYLSTCPYMPFFTTILDMYNGDEAQKIDVSMHQAIEDLSTGWLCKRLIDNNAI